MAQKKKGKNKFGITPSMIFLNLLLVLIICTVCFFTYNIMNGDDGTSSEPPFTAVTSEPPETEAPATDAPATDAPTTGDSSKPNSNTGVEGVAAVAGVAVVAAGAVIVAKKRK